MRQEELIDQVELRIDELASQIKNVAIEGAAKTRTANGFHDIEQKIIGICRKLAGSITGTVLVAIFEDRQWEDESSWSGYQAGHCKAATPGGYEMTLDNRRSFANHGS